MSEYIVLEPPAKALMFGFRAIGYSFPTAVADIIDNSISAEANEINIISNPDGDNTYFAFLDNGWGMDRGELENAMLLGSDRSKKVDSQLELGRFGLGLKAASLSQCRQFIVISKKNHVLNAMVFDYDIVTDEKRQWNIKVLDQNEILCICNVDKLSQYESGTLVIWRRFDRLKNHSKDFEDSFREAVSDSKRHVEWVFHRFYGTVRIYFNGKQIEKRDPFLKDSIGRQQTGHTELIHIDGEIIKVTPYTLPFANSLTADEKELLGNPKSIYDDQGFYLYRNKRLISWGSWLRMGSRSELNKLARIQVDIPSALDDLWMLDVKKSSARIPDKIKDLLRASIKDSTGRSKKTTKYPGIKEQSVINKVWERTYNSHDGTVRYDINRDNPIIVQLKESLGENENQLFDVLLSQLECYLPKYSILNDSADSVRILNSGEDIEEEHLIDELVSIIFLVNSEIQNATLELLLSSEAYQKLSSKKKEVFERVLG